MRLFYPILCPIFHSSSRVGHQEGISHDLQLHLHSVQAPQDRVNLSEAQERKMVRRTLSLLVGFTLSKLICQINVFHPSIWGCVECHWILSEMYNNIFNLEFYISPVNVLVARRRRALEHRVKDAHTLTLSFQVRVPCRLPRGAAAASYRRLLQSGQHLPRDRPRTGDASRTRSQGPRSLYLH